MGDVVDLAKYRAQTRPMSPAEKRSRAEHPAGKGLARTLSKAVAVTVPVPWSHR